MTRLGRYVGKRHRLLVWTLLLAGGGWIALTEYPAEVAVYADRPAVSAALAGVWLVGVMIVRRRERRAWQRLIAETPFEPQHTESRRPPLQRSLKGNVLTAETVSRGLVRQRGIRVEATAGSVTEPIEVTLTYVGSGGTERGLKTGTDALDETFVFEVETGSSLASVFNAEVQSVLLDLSTPGRLRIDGRHVSYEIPFTRVRPAELGTVSKAVATIAARMEHLSNSGRL